MKRLKELLYTNFNKRNTIVLVAGCLINVALFLCTYYLGAPFILDTVGTAYVALLVGPIAGSIVAVVTGAVQLIFYDGANALMYIFVGIAIALFVGISWRKKLFSDFFRIFGILFCCYLINVILSSLIPMFGISMREGDVWVVHFFNLFRTASYGTYVSAMFANMIMKLPDTLVAGIVVAIAYFLTPKSVRDDIRTSNQTNNETNEE